MDSEKTENQDLISVVIPAYNAEKFLEKTIMSVITQDYSLLEIIVVDDGSTDGTSSVIERILQMDPRVKYVYQDNSGVSEARNHGYRLSKGDYLAFLDADDVWLPENLSLKLQFLFNNKTVGLVHSDALLIDQNDLSHNIVKEGKSGWLLDDLLSWNGTCIPAPSSILVRREVIQEVGVFDPELSTSADQEFFFRVAARYEVGRIKKVTWHYRMHTQNMHSNISLMEHDCLLVYKKATLNGLFKSQAFRRKCYSNMYLILAGSWYHDGKNIFKAAKYTLRSISIYPFSIFSLVGKLFK